MNAQGEKVYVAIGADPHERFSTLGWVLRKWSPPSISIVLLHEPNSSSKHYVSTPCGKLPASYVSDEKMGVLKKVKGGDRLLSECRAFCGKVEVEMLKIEKSDEPPLKILVELISRLRITKLVMGFTSLKSSSWKCRGEIGGSFYVHRHKPDFCELFIICGGKLVFLREENNEGIIENDGGLTLARFKGKGSSLKGSWGKKLAYKATNERNLHYLPSSSTKSAYPNQWEIHVQEIEDYFSHLLSSNSNEEGSEVEEGALVDGQGEPDNQQNMSPGDKIDVLEVEMMKAGDLIESKSKETKANIERQAKAEWAMGLCTRRVEELEARIKEEVAAKLDTNKDLEAAKEEIYEVQLEVEDKHHKLQSLLDLQPELSNKLQSASLAKSRAESQLEKAIAKRANMIREIEDLRRQRDVFQCRIEFCREKDALGTSSRLSDSGFRCVEFSAEDIRLATDNFSELLRLKSAGDWTNVYRGRVKHMTVAIKMCNELSQEAFQAKVKLLSQIRHPHIVPVYGFCSELNCMVYEYLDNGCLGDALCVSQRSSTSRNKHLSWHARIKIAAQVSAGLGFLHSAQPRPIAHGNLNPSSILLDRNLVAKVHKLGSSCQSELYLDLRAFGNLVMQLLTGRDCAELVGEAMVMDQTVLVEALDEMAGLWPLDLAVELAGIAIRCIAADEGADAELSMAMVSGQLNRIKKRADDLMANGGCDQSVNNGASEDDPRNVPSVFLCPILQDVMRNPHIAADGFSYELEAIQEWIKTGHHTSPTTNLRLVHQNLTPNHTLRSLIQDWLIQRSIPLT